LEQHEELVLSFLWFALFLEFFVQKKYRSDGYEEEGDENDEKNLFHSYFLVLLKKNETIAIAIIPPMPIMIPMAVFIKLVLFVFFICLYSNLDEKNEEKYDRYDDSYHRLVV